MAEPIPACSDCREYTRLIDSYFDMVFEGDYRALEGIKSVLTVALGHETSPEFAAQLERYPGMCGTKTGIGLCVYRREELDGLLLVVDTMLDGTNGMDDRLKSELLKSFPAYIRDVIEQL